MGHALRIALAKRGSVYLFPNVEFSDVTKSKYGVLMENYTTGAKDLIIVFTTHRTEFRNQKSSVFVADGVIDRISGDTLIQCENYRAIPAEHLLENERVKYVGRLSQEVMKQVDEALTHVRHIDEATLIRMIG